jgi:hypothetical protein
MEDNNLFDISFSAVQDNDPIEVNEINNEVTETAETVEVVDDQAAEQKPEESTASAETTEEPQKEIKAEKEPENLIDIETESKTITTSDENSESPGQEDTSPITPFASLLQEKGFLHHTEAKDINSIEDLMSAVAKEREQMQVDIINSFPPELVNMAKAVMEGVPFDALKENKTKQLQYNNLKDEAVLENINLQKQLVADFLIEKGFKPEKIHKYIEKYEDMGELENEAKEALVELREISSKKEEAIREQYARQQQEMEERNKQVIANIEKTVTDATEILPGRPLTEEMRKKTLDSMLQIVGEDANGTPLNGIMKARSEDPVAFDMKIAYLMNLTNNFTDFSAINSTAKTSAAKEFEKTLTKGNNVSGKSGSPKKVNDGEVDILDGLKFI